MSKFMLLDAKAPATLGAVVEAVARLSTLSEAKILELVSAGKLQDVFPFQPAGDPLLPADSKADEELVEASALPLRAAQRATIVSASLPNAASAKRRAARTKAPGRKIKSLLKK
jgi:hypothetical protein